MNKTCSTRIHVNNLQFPSDLPWWFWGWDSFWCLVASCRGRYRMTVGCTGWISYTTHRSRPHSGSGIHHNYWPCSHTYTLLLKMIIIKFSSTSTSKLKISFNSWERLRFDDLTLYIMGIVQWFGILITPKYLQRHIVALRVSRIKELKRGEESWFLRPSGQR